MKNIYCLILLFFNINVFSQEIDNLNTDNQSIDSLRTELIKNSRYLFALNPIRHHGWITDYEELFTKDQIDHLNSIINEFEKETSKEIAIITLDYFRVSENGFEPLSLLIAQKWGVGKADKNNGILIAISKDYRKIRIHNGIGIEKILSNQETKDIIENFFIPEFKKNNYYSGTLNGLLALINKLK